MTAPKRQMCNYQKWVRSYTDPVSNAFATMIVSPEPARTLRDQIHWRLLLSGLGPSLDRPELMGPVGRTESWLRDLGLTRVPSPFDCDQDLSDALAANLIDLTVMQAMPERETAKEHNLRNVIVALGKTLGIEPFPERSYKG